MAAAAFRTLPCLLHPFGYRPGFARLHLRERIVDDLTQAGRAEETFQRPTSSGVILLVVRAGFEWISFLFFSLLFSFLFICKFTFPNRRWIRLWFGMQERDHETPCKVASVLDIRSWWVDLYKYFPLRQTLVKIGFLNRRCNKCPKTTMCVVYCNARPCWNAVNSRNYPLKNVQNKCEVSL